MALREAVRRSSAEIYLFAGNFFRFDETIFSLFDGRFFLRPGEKDFLGQEQLEYRNLEAVVFAICEKEGQDISYLFTSGNNPRYVSSGCSVWKHAIIFLTSKSLRHAMGYVALLQGYASRRN